MENVKFFCHKINKTKGANAIEFFNTLITEFESIVDSKKEGGKSNFKKEEIEIIQQ